MITKMFAVHDRAAEAFMQPFFAKTIGLACRMFETSCADPSTHLHKHPSDFTLCEIGEFDDVSGVLTTLENGPRKIADAKPADEKEDC